MDVENEEKNSHQMKQKVDNHFQEIPLSHEIDVNPSSIEKRIHKFKITISKIFKEYNHNLDEASHRFKEVSNTLNFLRNNIDIKFKNVLKPILQFLGIQSIQDIAHHRFSNISEANEQDFEFQRLLASFSLIYLLGLSDKGTSKVIDEVSSLLAISHSLKRLAIAFAKIDVSGRENHKDATVEKFISIIRRAKLRKLFPAANETIALVSDPYYILSYFLCHSELAKDKETKQAFGKAAVQVSSEIIAQTEKQANVGIYAAFVSGLSPFSIVSKIREVSELKPLSWKLNMLEVFVECTQPRQLFEINFTLSEVKLIEEIKMGDKEFMFQWNLVNNKLSSAFNHMQSMKRHRQQSESILAYRCQNLPECWFNDKQSLFSNLPSKVCDALSFETSEEQTRIIESVTKQPLLTSIPRPGTADVRTADVRTADVRTADVSMKITNMQSSTTKKVTSSSTVPKAEDIKDKLKRKGKVKS